MIHTVILDGRSYDLPKKNIAMAGKLDDVMRVDEVKGLSLRQRFEKLHVFVKETLGEETARELFGTDNLDEIDLSELTITVRRIIDAYEKPIADYQMEKNLSKLQGLPMRQLESITKAAEATAKMGK